MTKQGNMKHQCDLCKHSKFKISKLFFFACISAFPVGIPILIWIYYYKIFKKAMMCYSDDVDWLDTGFNVNQDCYYYKKQ